MYLTQSNHVSTGADFNPMELWDVRASLGIRIAAGDTEEVLVISGVVPSALCILTF